MIAVIAAQNANKICPFERIKVNQKEKQYGQVKGYKM